MPPWDTGSIHLIHTLHWMVQPIKSRVPNAILYLQPIKSHPLQTALANIIWRKLVNFFILDSRRVLAPAPTALGSDIKTQFKFRYCVKNMLNERDVLVTLRAALYFKYIHDIITSLSNLPLRAAWGWPRLSWSNPWWRLARARPRASAEAATQTVAVAVAVVGGWW